VLYLHTGASNSRIKGGMHITITHLLSIFAAVQKKQ